MVIYGWLKVAFGIFCLGKLAGGIFWLWISWVSYMCRWHLSTGGMFWLLQRFNLEIDMYDTQEIHSDNAFLDLADF